MLLATHAAAAATCFDGQMPPAPWARRAAQAAVRLLLLGRDGQPFGVASGIVVAGSGDAADPRNRILTAGHVLRDLAGPAGAGPVGGAGTLAVYGSDGRLLGAAQAEAAAAPGPAFGLRDRAPPSGLRFGDVAVLRMQAFAADGAARFAAIAGVRLAQRQPGGLLRGDFYQPAGIDPGVSGAGVLGRDGALIGVMAAKLDDPAVARVAVAARDPDGGAPITLLLPLHAVGYATPIADRAVLAALGRAGRAVDPPAGPLRARVVVPGFPRGACVAFVAVMGPT